MRKQGTLSIKALVVALFVVVGFSVAVSATANGAGERVAAQSKGDKNCDDFKSQKKAQKFFKKHNPRSDPHGLDADNDGLACEDNSCPCSYKLDAPREPQAASRR